MSNRNNAILLMLIIQNLVIISLEIEARPPFLQASLPLRDTGLQRHPHRDQSALLERQQRCAPTALLREHACASADQFRFCL